MRGATRFRFLAGLAAALLTAGSVSGAAAQPGAGAASHAGHGGGPALVQQAQQTAAVRIVDFSFNPQRLTISQGARVTWTHGGNAPHTVTSTNGVFDSKTLQNGATFSFVFDRPGDFNYRCEIHPSMTGTITVQAGAAGGGAAAAQATATPARTATAAPPLATIQAIPGGEQRAATGTLTFGDGQARSDQVKIEVQRLQAQPGTTITAWLLAANGDAVRLGTLSPDAGGRSSLTYTDGQKRNLIAAYERVVVTAETDPNAARPGGKELMRDEVAAPAMVHIRHLLARFDETPQNTPLATGMLGQAAVAADHANLAKIAGQAGDLNAARLHLEHIVNIIEGQKGKNYGDLDGNGKAENPGDGFGLLAYAEVAAQHARLAMDGAPRDETVNVHGQHVIISAKNVTDWATEARDMALPLTKAQNIAAVRQPLDRIFELLTGALDGRDANRDGKVDPVAGEGGSRTAYQHAQLMASMSPSAARATGESAPPAAAVTAAPAPTQAAQNQAATSGSGNTSGARLVLLAVIATAVLMAVLGVGAWLFTSRRGAPVS